MKKLYKLITLLMFITLSTNLMATDYMVSGAGTAAVNGTYTPDGTNMVGAPRWKHSGGTYYLHSNGVSRWVINDDENRAMHGYYINMTQSPFNQNIPPFTEWETEMGSDPAPTIAEAGPGLSYSSGIFIESSADDGSIDNSQPEIITHNNFGGGTFTGTNGDNFVTDGKVIVTNQPTGLTAVVTRTSSTTLSVTITGTAPNHANANDVSNLTFAFQNSAFSSGDASAISNATKNDLNVNFIQTYTVAPGGADFTTIEAAIAAASGGDIINVSIGTFTENELVVNKNLTIIGQGAPSTIIEAAATYNTATHRVFFINSGVTATIKNATIQHGVVAWGTGGGGIINFGNLTLQNVDLSYNVTGVSGGGIFNYAPGVLVMNNATVHHNLAGSGAGISSNHEAIITNSTITANSATYNADWNDGGGIYFNGTLVLTNSTISKNTCISLPPNPEPSAGLSFNITAGAELTISNTILAGNETSDYYTRPNTFSNGLILHDNGNNIVGYQSVFDDAHYFTSTTDILFNRKADKTVSTSWNRNNAVLANQNLNVSATLADNGTLNGTQTLALLSGSFAIDAGTSSGAPVTDQRGYTRNGATDIGAYEFCTPPSITSQSTATQTQCLNGTFTAITVSATGDGLSYQWFYNTSNGNSGGFTLNSANGAQTYSYTPQAGTAGTLYYYCVVTGTCGTATSAVSGAFVVNPLPTPTLFAAGATTFCQGGSVVLNVSGNALTFGLNSRVEIADNASLRFTNAQSYTLMAWVYIESNTNSWRGIVTKSRDQGLQYGIYLDMNNHWVYGAGANINITSPTAATTGWHHIAVVQTGSGNRELFVDGVSNGTAIAQTSNGTGLLRFGQSFNDFEKFDGGKLDEVSIFNTNLTSATINTWKNTSITNAHPDYANLVGYWKLDEGTGSATTADASGHGYTGTLVNSPVWVATSAPVNQFSSYLWSPGSATTPTLNVTTSGIYSVSVTGANGCSQTTSGTTVTVNPATAITSQSTDSQTQCLNGTFTSITANATGTGTLTYQWYYRSTSGNTGGTSLVS